MDRLKKVGEKSRPKRWLPSEDEEPEKRGTSEKRTKQVLFTSKFKQLV